MDTDGNSYISAFLPLTQGNNNAPSTITITVPNYTRKSNDEEWTDSGSSKVTGVLDSDVTFSLSNRFGPVIPDVSDLQDIFAIAGSDQMPSWIGTSAQVWKGTNPISFSFDMYVINWSPKCDYEKGLESLAQLCTVGPMNDTMDGTPSSWRVRVHGGYKPAILDDNKQYFSGIEVASGNSGKDGTKTVLAKTMDTEFIDLNGVQGTVSIQLGYKTRLKNLLVTRCDITPSVVEVYSPSSGVKPRPLYYRVGLSMQTCRTALSTDVPGLFGLSS